MYISKVQLKNITVFEDLSLELNNGINVFIGENGFGKTHIMKLLYSACQATNAGVSFSQKIVKCFCPDDYKISRLLSRKQGNGTASIKIYATEEFMSGNKVISAQFSNKTKKWDAEITGEDGWESSFKGLSSNFIPAKEILSNSYNLQAAVEKKNVLFDDTYIDIINSAKIDVAVGKNAAEKNSKLRKIEEIIDGKVHFDAKKDEFYLKTGSSQLEFNLVAEGIRKIALLWQLVKNGTLERGSVLFWDEPEANINPIHIPIIVDMLFMLQNEGVQIFISTHDYVLAKYLEIKSSDNAIVFNSLYKDDNGMINCEQSAKFSKLKNNKIEFGFNQLLDDVYKNEVE